MDTRILLILFFLIKNISAQDPAGTEIPSTYMPQGFALSSLNGTGFSKLINQSVSDIGCSNPAVISQYRDILFGISYQFETDVNPAWIGQMGHSRDHLVKPQSAAFIFPDENINYAVGFYQLYNSSVIFKEIPITTIEQPEGAGESFRPESDENVDIYILMMSYGFQDNASLLSIGAKLGVGVLNRHEQIMSMQNNITGYAPMGAVGLICQLAKNIKMAACYEWNPRFDEKAPISDNFIYDLDPDSAKGNVILTRRINHRLRSKKPDIFNVAMLFNWNNTFSSALDLNYIFWEQLSGNAGNNLDISSSIIINLQEDMTTSFGFLLTDRDYGSEIDNAFNTNSNLNAVFLWAGLKKKFSLIALNVSCASSHYLSGSWREQLIAKAGLDLYL